LVDQLPDIEYRIVGKGPLKHDLEILADELGIRSNISFLGHVSDSQLRDEYRRAAVFVLPCVVAEDGDRDVIPVVLKEAMATETPCVSTDVAVIPELITDGKNGCIVPQRNEDELGESIFGLLERPDQRRRMGRSGRQTVQDRFGIQDAVDELLNTFNSALE
jgi:glycosyltransferase involved in cell wall biosynthesis